LIAGGGLNFTAKASNPGEGFSNEEEAKK